MSSRRDLREKVYTAYLKRGDRDNENDNKQIVSEQTSLRAEKAALLGYPNFAAYILDENMAKTPEAAMNLLQQIWVPALSVAKKELADIKTRMNKDGVEGEPESWDWSYYAEKVRLDKYNLDENMIRPYFQLENVLQGVFTVANRLYGLEFKPIDSIPLCHPDAVPYEVTEANGEHLGVIYFDFFPRSTKGQGAWMTEYRTQYISSEGEYITPVVSLVLNFTKPSGSEPALLNIDEVSTLFHEFGHGLHGLLSDNRYKSLSGTSVPTDFVELPSQIMENWCMHPEVLKLYAKHYQTGALIPDELVQKIADSRKFNQGFMTTELTAASILDQYYHIRTVHDSAITDVRAFEGNVLSQLGLIRQIPPRYHSTYFKHIFGGGYSARYYSYLWSETLDADAFEAFTEKGIFDQETAASFRKNILEKGGSDEPMTLYKNFRGHEPNIEALLKRRGLL
jgi:peptidyl-dipeptidase Dcp